MAWLHATPEHDPKRNEKPKAKSRYEQYKDTMIAELPELSGCHYLFDVLQKIGVYELGMSGPVPISWSEIASWQAANEISLTPAELEIIKRLSADYCSQLHKSSNPAEMPPAAISLDGKDFDREYMSQTMKAKPAA